MCFDRCRDNSDKTFLHIYRDAFCTLSHTTCSCFILSWSGVLGTVLEGNQIKPPIFMSRPMPRFCMISMKRNIKSGCITQGGEAKTEGPNALNWSPLVWLWIWALSATWRECLRQSSQSYFFQIKGHYCTCLHSQLNQTLLADDPLSNSTVWITLPRVKVLLLSSSATQKSGGL